MRQTGTNRQSGAFLSMMISNALRDVYLWDGIQKGLYEPDREPEDFFVHTFLLQIEDSTFEDMDQDGKRVSTQVVFPALFLSLLE